MIDIVEYTPEHRQTWNDFVSASKNGLFLFHRDYMEYHSDRFQDHSLLFLQDGRTVALLPANVKEGVLYSHGGLTFGGVVSSVEMKTPVMLEIFVQLIEHCKNQGIQRMIYKAIPHIYHTYPSEEDLYALHRSGANLFRRDVTSSIWLPNRLEFDHNRVRSLKKAHHSGIEVKRTYDFPTFMKILSDVLGARHHTKPVHTPEEIQMLAERFPDNIKLFASYQGHDMLAGTITYESKNVAHTQYIANSKEGMKIAALDPVFEFLITSYYEKKYFDFGISTEKEGHFLNKGLIAHKESFGARAVVHDFYELIIN